MIHFTNAGHTFKNGTVGLADINLQIDAGEFVYIVGESGAGKSTLTKLVLRELVATQGTIRVDGIDLAKLKKRRLPYYRRKIGFVFQNFRLLADRSAWENVAFACECIGLPRREVVKRTREALEFVELLDRKLRVISENTDTEEEWFTWTKRAFQSVYGFEYQGDSLLLARENLFVTFVEVYRERFGKLPHLRQMKVIANIIAWNLWQMDGTKYVVPGSCKENKIEIISWFGSEEQIDLCPGCKSGNIRAHNGIYSIIKDWRSNQTMTFLSMVRGGSANGSV